MSWFSKVLFGVDLDEEQKRGDETDAKLAALNQEMLETGKWNQNQFDQAQAHLAAGHINDVTADVTEAFKEGFQESADNLTGGVKKTLSGIVGNVFGAIPISVWLLLAVALFLYMGGAVFLKGRLAK